VAQNVCLAILSVGLLTAAWAGDKIPRRWILGFGALMAVLLSFPFFRAAAEHSINLIVLFAFAGVVASFYNGAMCGVVGDLFVTRIRFSGVALSFNLAFSVFSGIAPLVATALVKATGSATGPAYYMTGCALLTLLSSLVLKRYDGRILGELAERERVTAAAPEPALSAAQAD
jgi:MFS family permease